MVNLAILASGSGTNAERICEYFKNHLVIRVRLILCNKPGAYVLQRAARLGIPYHVFGRKEFYETGDIQDLLEKNDITFLILAGFLWLIPAGLLQAYDGKILNIHPALLPKYGGKGMFGEHVHEAVIQAGDKESGISIHYVNDQYDKGDIIFQARCQVMPGDSPATLAARIHELEYEYYPKVIENVVMA